MPDYLYMLIAILIAGTITWALRAFPFLIIVPLSKSTLIEFLRERMPLGIMLILAVYTLHDIGNVSGISAAATLSSLAVTVLIHLWKHNLILSIFAGTALNVLLHSCFVP
ncbi:branched-chain amino acid transporter permease [Schaalia sp. lx-100]|uniref:branched-chain amino acid transporter permease n=1 Tax=Schaalia sp. lx-100 TaxID=2899081 RepID=UPI001E39A350|nr:AzlD domain-containing protein [Schaalia sp. lx-100]